MPVTTVYCGTDTGNLSSNKNIGDFNGALSGAGSESWQTGQWRGTVGNFWHSNNRANIAYMILYFDLSSIPAGDVITNVVLHLYGQQNQAATNFNILIAEFGESPPWSSANWQTGADLAALTELASLNTSAFNASGYNTFESAALTDAVNNASGSIAIIVWSDRTESASWPGSSNTYESVNFYSQGQGGTSQDPKLVITHDTGGGAAQNVSGSAHVDTDSFGNGVVSRGPVSISGSLFTDADSFGSGQVTPGAVLVSGSLHMDADSFGAGVLSAGPVSIGGSGHVDPDEFGGGVVSQGAAPAQTVGGAGHVDTDEFGSGLVSVGPVAIVGTAYVDQDAFGSGNVRPGSVTITGTLYADPDTFGAGAVSLGGAPSQSIAGAAHIDADEFGSGVVSQGSAPPQVIGGQSFLDDDVFGSGAVDVGPVFVGGGSFVDIDSFGSGLVAVGGLAINGASFIDLDQFGSGAIAPGPVVIAGNLFVDPDQFGAGAILGSAPSPSDVPFARTFLVGAEQRSNEVLAGGRAFIIPKENRMEKVT